MKNYKKCKIPNESAWDKKSYDPIKFLYNLKEEHPIFLEEYFFNPYFNLKYNIRYFFVFIAKLIKWIPVLWKDRDYDDFYIFEILKVKILQQRNYLVKSNRHTNISQDNFWMTICLNLIERIQKSYYEIEYFDYFEQEIKFVEYDNKEESGLYTMESEIKKDELLTYINMYPTDRRKTINYCIKYLNKDLSNYESNQENRHFLCIQMSISRHKKAINLLFLILSNKIEHWWD